MPRGGFLIGILSRAFNCVARYVITFDDEQITGETDDLVDTLIRVGRPDAARALIEREAPQFLLCIGNPASSTEEAVQRFLESSLFDTRQLILDSEQGVTAAIDRSTATATSAVLQAEQAIQANIADTRNVVTARLDGMVAQIDASIAAGIADISVDIGESLNAALTPINATLTQVDSTLASLRDDVRKGTADTLNGLERVVLGVGDAIRSGIRALVPPIAAVAGAVQEASERASEEIASGVADALKAFLDSLGLDVAGVARAINQVASRVTEFTASDDVSPALDAVNRLFAFLGDPEQNRQALLDFAQAPRGTTWLSRIVIWLGMQITTIGGSLPAFLSIATARGLHELSRAIPWQLLTPSDAALAVRYGVLSLDGFLDAMARQGFTSDDAGRLLELRRQPATPADVLHFWKRGFFDDDTVDAELRALGFDGKTRDALRSASDLIPPVQDLITMAVREVFTPAIVERFGQAEDFPPQFAEFARQQGLTEEWARRYWAAHWSLPSAQQGFEMLHRGVITPDDLTLLLRALDVMPFWRNALTQIAFAPFTRVDIRRMHAMGILDRPAVVKAHRDIGYDPEKAELLTQFVERLNGATQAEDDDELGRLTRAAILAFFRDGLLDRDRAKRLLMDARHTAAAADLYLDSVEFEEDAKDRRAEIDVIVANAESGALSFDEAQDRLAQLGLETAEVAKAVTRVTRAQRTKTRLPTRAEGETLLRDKAITELEYRDLLTRLGYPARFVEAFVQSAKGESSDNQ